MKKHIIILKKGNACYGSTSYFAERVNDEFKRAGISSDIVEINCREDAELFVKNCESLNEITDIIDFNTDIFSYVYPEEYFQQSTSDTDIIENNSDNVECPYSHEVHGDKNYIFDIKSHVTDEGYIRLWHIILDHPLYHNSVLKHPLNNMRVICLDETHADYIRKYYRHIKKVLVMPLPADTAKKLVTYNDRSREVLFTGTYTPSESVVALAMHGGDECMQVFQKMSSYLLENPDKTIENAYAFALKEKSCKGDKCVTNEKDFADGLELNFFADMFIRAVVREELLMEMLRCGINVDIFGHGWEKFIKKCEAVEAEEGKFAGKIRLCGEVDYKKLPEIYADTKIALNVLPWFKAGQHDRIALAMCNGCVCVSDESLYLEKNFVDGENIFLYSLEDMTGAAMIVRELLAHPLEAARAAAKGYAYAVSNLSFKKYIEIFTD